MTTLTLGYGQNQNWSAGILTGVTQNTNNRLALNRSVASGGTISTSGVYKIHKFTASGTFIPIDNMIVDFLVVAGGGGGGGVIGSGGGAGGLIYQTGVLLTPQTYTVTVGDGGTAGPATDGSQAGDGKNSVFSTYTATGGGGGSAGAGRDGGSGGGSGRGGVANGKGTAGQGNDGGKSTAGNDNVTGGGGGAGAVGDTGSGTQSGVGGVGLSYDISGSSTYYSGGGGGGSRSSATAGAGGNGGGGAGHTGGGSGTAGTDNTGGGGGGAGYTSGGFNTGSIGGSGVVIIRYAITTGTHSVIMDMGSSRVPDTLAWSSIEDPTAGAAKVEVNTVQYADPKTISIRGSDTAPSGAVVGTLNDSDAVAHDYWTSWGSTSPSAYEEIATGGTVSAAIYRYIEIRETLRNNY